MTRIYFINDMVYLSTFETTVICQLTINKHRTPLGAQMASSGDLNYCKLGHRIDSTQSKLATFGVRNAMNAF